MKYSTRNQSVAWPARSVIAACAAGTLAICFFTSGAAAQNEVASKQPSDRTSDRTNDRASDREPEPEALRERLVRQRQDLVKAQALIDEAIARLDKGEPIGDLVRELAALRIGARLGGPGPRREGGPGGPGGPGGRDGLFDDDRMPPGGPREGREGRDGREGRGGRDGPESLEAADAVLMDVRPGEPLTDAQRERISTFLKETAPRVGAKLEELHGADPKTADRLYVRMAPRIREAMAVRRRDPELFELRIDEIRGGMAVLEAVKAYRDAKSSPQEGREARIAQAEAGARAALLAQFEQRWALEAHEIRTSGERLEERRAEFESRAKDRDVMIERMIERLRDNKPIPDGPGPRRGPEGRPGGERLPPP